MSGQAEPPKRPGTRFIGGYHDVDNPGVLHRPRQVRAAGPVCNYYTVCSALPPISCAPPSAASVTMRSALAYQRDDDEPDDDDDDTYYYYY